MWGSRTSGWVNDYLKCDVGEKATLLGSVFMWAFTIALREGLRADQINV